MAREGVLLGAVDGEPQPLQAYGGRVEVLDEEGRVRPARGREPVLDPDVDSTPPPSPARNQQPPRAASTGGLATSGIPSPSP